MGNIKQINFKNRTYYFFNGMINIEDFDSNLLKIDKKSYKNIDIYNTGYITMKDFVYVKLNNVNPLYLIIGEADGYIEGKNGNTYLHASKECDICHYWYFLDKGFKYETICLQWLS